jgi:hypothetical protein
MDRIAAKKFDILPSMDKFELQALIDELRQEVCNYRNSRIGQAYCIDFNAALVCGCLVEYWLVRQISIQPEDERWFNAGWMIHYSADGLDGPERIPVLYEKLVGIVKANNFFR